ncbi:hypothetical protein [Amycolatopsis lurida]|uniref:Type 2A encapsulin shell protein SrpI-like domain-containing protein n=1 Tax=Amycolatopsis lurida NRRL 2430 TaxID=1460371 RepID=A0A2P2FZ89_AMYLU|nr:hypothetical protein [Amycolatopsis lurida]KFU82025.1 hypothetical protein BB31_06695 [Amycolatopsis lurida NRRL 2430]
MADRALRRAKITEMVESRWGFLPDQVSDTVVERDEVSAYYSAAILVSDAMGVLDQVEIGR